MQTTSDLPKATTVPSVGSGALFGDGRPQCACVSEKYGHCPEPVAWGVNLNDNEQWLCERCYQNVKAGAYGPRVKLLAAIPLPPNIQ